MKVLPGTQRVERSWQRFAFAEAVNDKGMAAKHAGEKVTVSAEGDEAEVAVSLGVEKVFVATIWIVLLKQRYFEPVDLRVAPEDVTLTDNRGHRFAVRACSGKRANPSRIIFVVDEGDNQQFMEFNNRDYFLSLKVSFEWHGQRTTVEVPKIFCVFDNPPEPLLQ